MNTQMTDKLLFDFLTVYFQSGKQMGVILGHHFVQTPLSRAITGPEFKQWVKDRTGLIVLRSHSSMLFDYRFSFQATAPLPTIQF
jgi:hypothetical protein